QPPVTSTTDTLAGTPTLAGNYTFSESVADSGSPTEMATQNYSVTVLPQPPTNLTGSPQTTSIITLTWNASAAQDITGYRIHYGTSSGVYTTTISAGNVNQYVVMGLSTATTYYFVVDTISTSGVESVFSNEVAVATQQPSP
ncbi:MAG: fibronectin type III domain-containing protein, partial [Candidatus Acidiferrum sp.]